MWSTLELYYFLSSLFAGEFIVVVLYLDRESQWIMNIQSEDVSTTISFDRESFKVTSREAARTTWQTLALAYLSVDFSP